MKFFIVFASALAAASAGLIAPIGPVVYGAPQHLPVIGPNGVPIDTPAVQQARAAHLSHKAEAHARNGDLALLAHAHPLAIASPVLAAQAVHVGIPETPEVVIAKQAHFAAHAEALARNGHIAPIHHILRRGILAAYAAPIALAAQHLPVIGPNGVPIDTPAVQQARAAHLAHKAEAHARNGDVALLAHAAPIVAHSAPVVAHAAPVVAAASPIWAQSAIPAAYATSIGIPAVTANGVPLETPEVVAAKVNHFAAHSEALARNSPIISEGIIAAAPIATVW